MEFAIDRYNDSVKFALERISKASLQLSPHQMNALQTILSGKDTYICQLAKENRSSLSVSHTAMTFYTVVNLSKASRTVLYCCSVSEGRVMGRVALNSTLSITRLEEAKKLVAAEILSPIAGLLVVTSSSIFLRAFADR